MSKEYIVRFISSKDHPSIKKPDLLRHIKQSGTDRYDSNRKQLFDDFYGKHNVDFFGTYVDADMLNDTIQKLKHEFSEKTLGDRNKSTEPDIAILYKSDKCSMIENVYENQSDSDCFRFTDTPSNAFKEVREL